MEKKISGTDKVAILLMAIERDVSVKMFGMMDEDEIKEISKSMVSLGSVESEVVEKVMEEFNVLMTGSNAVEGNLANTKNLLGQILGQEATDEVLNDIYGPTGKDIWDKLNNVNEEMLASFLVSEYPQTIALILSKMKSSKVAKILGILPEDLSFDVVQRMLTIEPVKKEVLSDIENTLKNEFMANLFLTKKVDTYEIMSEIFNNFDRATEQKFFERLESVDKESAERIKSLMFTFDDLLKLDAHSIQIVIKGCDNEMLTIALKGSSEEMRQFFFSNMSERASKILKEEMEAKGPIRLKEVDEAQMKIVKITKDLAEKRQITIPDGTEADQMIM
jgi:flagellar motor switch protein FliG